jgi:hypothetical protein
MVHGRMPADLSGGSVTGIKDIKAVFDNEASQRSAATFQKRIVKRDGALGCRQGRGSDDGRCAARDDCGHFRGSKVRLAPGTGGTSVGVGGSRAIKMTGQTIQQGSGRWPLRNMAKTAASAGAATNVGRAGRVYSSCEPMSHRGRRCIDTYPGKCIAILWRGALGGTRGCCGGGHPLRARGVLLRYRPRK